MAKKKVNSDIYNLSKLVDDIKSLFIPNETEETLAISTYGYLGAIESHRLQTQVEMTGELSNEVFPSRARLERNIITHAIMANIEDINAIPAKMTGFLAIRESDILDYFNSENLFIIDRECPLYIGDFEFHLEYDIGLRKINIPQKNVNTYTAQYIIPAGRDVPTSTITTANQYLSPPAVVNVDGETYIYITVILSQVEHHNESKKLVTSNIIDNKTMNFEFENQLAYFEIHCKESDQDYYILPVFEGSSVPDTKSQYYCWYQYIDTNLIRVRFDRSSYIPGLNTEVECLVKTSQGSKGNFKYKENSYIELESSNYGYKGISCLFTPITESSGGKDRKSKKELQSLIPKEYLARGSLTTITDLNNYFGMLDTDENRIIIQKKIDNQIERVYYAYLVAKDSNDNVIPSNTIDIYVDRNDLIESKIQDTGSSRYLLPGGACFKLGSDGIGRINHDPLIGKSYEFTPTKVVSRGYVIEDQFSAIVTDDNYEALSCSVELSGSSTPTLVFPREGADRYSYTDIPGVTEIENYLQLGVGKTYAMETEYVTKEDNTTIVIRDKYLANTKFIKAYYYTSNPEDKHYFNKLPIAITGISKNTRITFGIERQLTGTFGIVYFNLNDSDKQYKLHQKNTVNLSYILNNLGLSGDIISVSSSDETTVKLDPIQNVKLLGKNKKALLSKNVSSNSDRPYTLNVVPEKDLPPIGIREDNDWYYVVEGSEKRKDDYDTDNLNSSSTADKYKLYVYNEGEQPAIIDRSEDEWFYIIQNRNIRDVEDYDPEQPDDSGDITGTDYLVTILKNITDPTYITVDLSGTTYILNLSQDRNLIENGIYVVENSREMVATNYTTFVPTLDQDIWPTEINIGDIIHYTLRYKSSSNTYLPTIAVKLSRGLDYVTFTNTLYYPDGNVIPFEPIPGKISMNELGFIYTNPYAININGYRLYSSFYMMSMNENPYLHFDNINNKSNVQFISTNAYWSRAFSGYEKDMYKLSISFTQSVQFDLGLVSTDEESNITGLGVKAVAVFYRNKVPYRYRTLDLVNYDPTIFEFSFEQYFYPEDIFDIDNNIKCNNFQVAGQLEFSVKFTYDNFSKTVENGSYIKASEFSLPYPIENLYSSDPNHIGIVKTENDYKIIPINSFDDSIEIIAICKNDNEEIQYTINAESTNPASTEYGYFNPNTTVKVYTLCTLPDIDGKYSINIGGDDFNSICPGFKDKEWTLTNIFDIVNGVNFYHNYSEIMGSRIIPDGPKAAVLKCNQEACLLNFRENISAIKLLETFKVIGKRIVEINVSDDTIISVVPANPDNSEAPDYNISIIKDFKTKESINITTRDSDGYESITSISVSARDEYGNVIMNGTGYYVYNVPMIGYDYSQDEFAIQDVIENLNHKKAYIDSSVKLLENSFGVDFKLFNTYGPSRTYYIIRDSNTNSMLDDSKEYIDRINLTFYFRIKLLSQNDSYTKDNIVREVKEYIEDIDELGELHIPNLVTQITTNYKEQISYFEYLGFNEYGPDIQHIYKDLDNEIPIHVAPEFLNINNVTGTDGLYTPDINIYISEI